MDSKNFPRLLANFNFPDSFSRTNTNSRTFQHFRELVNDHYVKLKLSRNEKYELLEQN